MGVVEVRHQLHARRLAQVVLVDVDQEQFQHLPWSAVLLRCEVGGTAEDATSRKGGTDGVDAATGSEIIVEPDARVEQRQARVHP